MDSDLDRFLTELERVCPAASQLEDAMAGRSLSVGPQHVASRGIVAMKMQLNSDHDLFGISAPSICPPLPRNVKLVHYRPKAPPVAIDTCSIVTDVESFIRRELSWLYARLQSPVQIRGGDGVFMILHRLRQVGLELEIREEMSDK